MPKITFIEHSGTRHSVEAQEGVSVMEAAIENMVPGITADCGGSCSCATCHVYVDEAWLEVAGRPGDIEQSLIDFSMAPQANSRLSCQIEMKPELDGLVVRLPEDQG